MLHAITIFDEIEGSAHHILSLGFLHESEGDLWVVCNWRIAAKMNAFFTGLELLLQVLEKHFLMIPLMQVSHSSATRPGKPKPGCRCCIHFHPCMDSCRNSRSLEKRWTRQHSTFLNRS